MKRPFRKKPVQTTGRQRLLSQPEQASPSFSYHARRSEQELNTGRQQERQLINPAAKKFGLFWLQRFGLILLLVAVVASLVNVLSLSSNAKIQPLNSGDSATFLHDQAAYQAAANKVLASSIWNHNKVTVDTAKVSQQLLQQFPELSSVSVTLPLLAHRPLVYIQAAQPSLIFVASNGSFILDSQGKALLPSSSDPAITRLNLPTVTDQSGLQVQLNHQVLTTGDVSFVQIVIAELAAKNISLSTFTLPPAARELDAHPTGLPYFIKFNLESGDARQQAGTFLATQATLQKQGITPTQYIDVRVDGRAYYL